MSEMDNDIRNGLRKVDEAGKYDPDRGESLGQMLAESFRGKHRWMAWIAWIDSLVFTAVAVFAAVQFFRVDGVRQMILYAAVFGLSSGIVLFLVKIWYWMLMNRNSIKREVKRLELRIAELIEALDRQ